jgi:pimeloyl-ACP methyl ester carboxylesterase
MAGNTTTTFRKVASADGTPIGYRRLGDGPPIVIVHGGLTTGAEWLDVGQELAQRHAVFLPDRRGRGLSGDGPDYGLSTEVADLRALLEVAGDGATLFGHSYGAICALATAAAVDSLASLVVYEPPLPLHGPRDLSAVAGMSAALSDGDGDRALTVALSLIIQASDDTIAALRRGPHWQSMVDAAPTLERELHVINQLAGNLDWLATVTARTLVLLGTESPQRRHEVTDYLAATLPDVSVTELPGQAHYAQVAQPAVVAAAVQAFLES